METVPLHSDVAIVGTGFGGLATALRLLADGHDVLLLERADAVGGVWRDNTYPGAACDVESRLYGLAAVPHAGWTRRFARQPEIRAYLERVADRRGPDGRSLRERVRFGTDVLRAAWDDDAALWRLETTTGDVAARVLVSASGALAEPRFPALPGIDAFRGALVHTSRWAGAPDLAGLRVAVVGTGASAVQVVPEIAPRAARLTLFQRTPAYVIPRRDRALRAGSLLARVARPLLYGRHEALGHALRSERTGRAAAVLSRAFMRSQVADPALRARLTADFRVGCKRILLSDDYYPALTRPNVTLTGAAARLTETGVVDAEGVEHAADVVVFATGFTVHELPIAARIVGREGRTLADVWGGAPVAHVTTTVAGFPNLFLSQGPSSGLGHSSVVLTAEAQAEHVAGALAHLRATGAASVEPTAAAQAAFVAEVDRMNAGSVWESGCQSWYLDRTGRNAAIWPGSVGAFRRRVEPFRPQDYHIRRADGTPAMPPDTSAPGVSRRLSGAAARALGLLPEAAAQRLAGAPVVTDGQRLDPHVQLLLRLEPGAMSAAAFRADPVAARHRLRRDVLALDAGRTRVGSVEDLTVDGAAGPLRARLYRPAGAAAALVVFFHGGGYVEGDLDTHDALCRLLCRQAGHAVLSVDYRLAPEHPFPAAADDALAAFRWAQAAGLAADVTAGPVCVGGDSAGGQLAAVVAQMARGDRPPAAQLLIYPATDTPTDRPSRHLFDGYLLPDDIRAAFFELYSAGADAADPRLSPGLAARLDGLAPALVVTAGFDVLRDEGEAYAHALCDAGVPVRLFRAASLPHGFMTLTAAVPAARRETVAAARQWRRFVHTHAR